MRSGKPKFSKDEALNILFKCATAYENNLLDKNVLFLYSYNKKTDFFESAFLDNNFKHLTGIISSLNPALFFSAALNFRLSKNDIAFNYDGTTELKLRILPRLMDIHLCARMVGDYDYSGRVLVADKLAGTTTSVMGFSKEDSYYYPSTTLKENLSNIAKKPYSKIVAMFIKPQQDEQYTELSYALNDKEVFTDNVLSSIKDKVDFPNLKASFPIPWDNEEQD